MQASHGELTNDAPLKSGSSDELSVEIASEHEKCRSLPLEFHSASWGHKCNK